jgi:peptide deformylase
VVLRKIARMGHPVLRQVAARVADPTAPDIRALVNDLVETMADAPGVGLAAPQVHVSRQVLVFWVPRARAGDPNAAAGAPDGPVPLTALINPEIEPLDDELVEDWEGCLSVPDLTARVPRYRRIRYRGLGVDGERIERLAEGFHARVMQHEYDHLQGRLYIDRVTDLTTLGFLDEVRRSLEREQAGSGEAGGG